MCIMTSESKHAGEAGERVRGSADVSSAGIANVSERGDFWEQSWQKDLRRESRDVATDNQVAFEIWVNSKKAQFLQTLMPSEGRLIELGCGSARLLAFMAHSGQFVNVALDRSGSATRLALATGESTRTLIYPVQGDVFALPFKTGSFDILISGGLLEHFEDPRPVL
jgi:SAM-dependent methyltransferase